MKPTLESVVETITEYDRIGSEAFLKKYEKGYAPTTHFLHWKGRDYPMKAIWVAAHRPPANPSTLDYRDALKGFPRLGFTEFVNLKELAAESEEDRRTRLRELEVREGKREIREVERIKRNPAIVLAAKALHTNGSCQACEFNFGETYGAIGLNFIECHHIEPLHGREGVDAVTKVEDLAMLCANCHRMVHRSSPCLTIEELKEILQGAKQCSRQALNAPIVAIDHPAEETVEAPINL